MFSCVLAVSAAWRCEQTSIVGLLSSSCTMVGRFRFSGLFVLFFESFLRRRCSSSDIRAVLVTCE